MTENKEQSSIWSLRANVSRQEAARAFGGAGLDVLYWRAVRGQLQRLARAYVPFRIYRVKYELGSVQLERFFALESVEGVLDLFEFSIAPQANQLVPIETRNYIAPALPKDRAESILKEKVLRIIFQHGFFRVREPNLQVEPLAMEFSRPYWLGFYGEDGNLCCRVMDAVRRQMEGGKATAFFERWLAS